MNLIQILLLIIIAGFIFKTAMALKKKKIHTVDFVMWFIFWLGVGAVVSYPRITQLIADFVGIGRGADLVVYLGMIALYFFFYQLLVKVKQLDEKITLLGREIAIKSALENSKK